MSFTRLRVIAIAVTAIAAGCGGDDSADGVDATQQAKYNKANEGPQVYARRIAKLLETTRSKKDCEQLDALMRRSRVRFPCPPDESLRRSMARFELVGAETYGNGGIVDYRSGSSPDGAAIVLIVAPDRGWGISDFGVATKPSVGTSDADSRDGYDAAVKTYLRAVRERDCTAYKEVMFTALDSPRTSCSKAFDETADLRKLLKRNPRAKLTYEGGNSAYGFYTFETSDPRSAQTVAVVSGEAIGAHRSSVMAVSPSPTAQYQRAVIKKAQQLLKQQREDNQMLPSRKAE